MALFFKYSMAKIIVALDYTNPLDALEMAAKLRDVVDGFKINHALWSQSVYIKDYTDNNELFIDCKLWDTPNTVKQIVQKIVDKGATMTTICTHNNSAVFEAIQPFADQIKLLGVTYLTSWHGQERADMFKDTVQVMWRDNIDRVVPYGFAGMICSPRDIDNMSFAKSNKLLKVCPGIQYESNNSGQARTCTPTEAVQLGANYLVIGRSITEASDPVATVQNIRKELDKLEPDYYVRNYPDGFSKEWMGNGRTEA